MHDAAWNKSIRKSKLAFSRSSISAALRSFALEKNLDRLGWDFEAKRIEEDVDG